MTTEIVMKQGEGKWPGIVATQAGEDYDLTGATFAFKAKTSETADTWALEKADGDFDKTDIAAGKVKVNLTPADSAALEVQNYVAYFVITLDPGKEVKIEAWQLKIEHGVT